MANLFDVMRNIYVYHRHAVGWKCVSKLGTEKTEEKKSSYNMRIAETFSPGGLGYLWRWWHTVHLIGSRLRPMMRFGRNIIVITREQSQWYGKEINYVRRVRMLRMCVASSRVAATKFSDRKPNVLQLLQIRHVCVVHEISRKFLQKK